MADEGAGFYGRIVRRVTIGTIVFGVAGTVALSVLQGVRFGLGFLIGSALSAGSFWRWRKLVESLGGPPERKTTWSLVMRFVVLAAAGYAIINYLQVKPVAVFLGLLVSAAAVLVSIILELIYART
jgi:hypothetical protein